MVVARGQRLTIPATDWNDIGLMLREWRNGRLSIHALGFTDAYAPSEVWCKNVSANDVGIGDVLGLGDPVISPTDNLSEFKSRIAFEGSIPSTSTPHYGQYGIAQEGASKNGGFCRIVVAGCTFAKLNITHASDLACEISNGVSTYLTTGYVGTSRILWKSSGTGSTDKWGLIRVGDTLDNFVGKADGTITANGGTGTVSVWDAAFAGDLVMNVTGCYNHTATEIAATDKVSGTVIRGIPVIGKLC